MQWKVKDKLKSETRKKNGEVKAVCKLLLVMTSIYPWIAFSKFSEKFQLFHKFE